jgi:hypothetical protein
LGLLITGIDEPHGMCGGYWQAAASSELSMIANYIPLILGVLLGR